MYGVIRKSCQLWHQGTCKNFSTESVGNMPATKEKCGQWEIRFNLCVEFSKANVDCYVNRLRKLASSCQFRTLTDEMMRNKLVIGIQDKSTKARLLREKDLSLDKALDMCTWSKVINKQLKSIQKDEKQNNEELNLVQD